MLYAADIANMSSAQQSLGPLLSVPASMNKLRFKSDIYFANAVDINQESNLAVIQMTITQGS